MHNFKSNRVYQVLLYILFFIIQMYLQHIYIYIQPSIYI